MSENADDAQNAHRLTQNAHGVARSGGGVVAAAIAKVSEVGQSSQRMDEIIALIDSIAFQTNVLALNASVEAVRAGAQGRGFAVVAAEVRSLAQRSAAAAKEVRELIAQSRQQIGAVVASVKQAEGNIAQVIDAVGGTHDLVARIAQACAFQARSVKEIDATLDQLTQVTAQNAMAVERGAAIAETLGLEAQRLVEFVQRFQLEDMVQRNAMAAGAPTPALPLPRTRH